MCALVATEAMRTVQAELGPTVGTINRSNGIAQSSVIPLPMELMAGERDRSGFLVGDLRSSHSKAML